MYVYMCITRHRCRSWVHCARFNWICLLHRSHRFSIYLGRMLKFVRVFPDPPFPVSTSIVRVGESDRSNFLLGLR